MCNAPRMRQQRWPEGECRDRSVHPIRRALSGLQAGMDVPAHQARHPGGRFPGSFSATRDINPASSLARLGSCFLSRGRYAPLRISRWRYSATRARTSKPPDPVNMRTWSVSLVSKCETGTFTPVRFSGKCVSFARLWASAAKRRRDFGPERRHQPGHQSFMLI